MSGRTTWRWLLGGMVALTFATQADAHFFARWFGWGRYHYSAPVCYYYYPVVMHPAPVGATVIPLTSGGAQGKVLAVPSTKEPPLVDGGNKPPIITESRSGEKQAGAADGLCKVGFWNLTGADVTLKINGQPRVLPKDRAVTVEIQRAFVWQIDQREPTSERVAADQNFHEVILRK